MAYYESGTGVKKEADAEWLIKEGVVGGPVTNIYCSQTFSLQVSNTVTETCWINAAASSGHGKD